MGKKTEGMKWSDVQERDELPPSRSRRPKYQVQCPWKILKRIGQRNIAHKNSYDAYLADKNVQLQLRHATS